MDSTFMKYCFTFFVVMITTKIQAEILDINSTENVSFDPVRNTTCSAGCPKVDCRENLSTRGQFHRLIKVGKKTYHMHSFFKVDWYAANQYCRYINMQLASISNKEENEILKNQMRWHFGVGKNVHFWTSGNDLSAPTSFVWASTGIDFYFSDYHKDQPDHSIHGNETEHCVEITGNNEKLAWNDWACSFKAFIICETYT